jgi:hypothetical protein
MRTELAAIMVGLSISQAAAAGAIERLPRGVQTGAPVVVRFGSHAMGIDQKAYDRVAAYATSSPLVEKTVAAFWGREGEVDLGLFPKAGKADEVLAELRSMRLPESRVGWTKILDMRR